MEAEAWHCKSLVAHNSGDAAGRPIDPTIIVSVRRSWGRRDGCALWWRKMITDQWRKYFTLEVKHFLRVLRVVAAKRLHPRSVAKPRGYLEECRYFTRGQGPLFFTTLSREKAPGIV